MLTVLPLLVGPALAQAIPHSRVEEFDNTAFKDAVNTTADWNTAAGKLKLFPFQPTLLGSYDTPGFARPKTSAVSHHALSSSTWCSDT